MSKPKPTPKTKLSEYDKKKTKENVPPSTGLQKTIFIDRCMNTTWQIDELLLNSPFALDNLKATQLLDKAKNMIFEAAALAHEPITAVIDKDKIR